MKICTICGSEYSPTSNRQKTCSDPCRSIQRKQQMDAHNERYYKEHPEMFWNEDRRNKQQERRRAKGQKPRSKKIKVTEVVLGVCLWCGDYFPVSVDRRKFCTDECRRSSDLKKKRIVARNRKGKDRVDHAMGLALWNALHSQKAGRSWESIVGYSLEDLMAHLESQFTEGMTWDNYGRDGWHIDHIMPRSSFSYISDECLSFKECWGLSNLQPLWEVDNLRKGAKIPA